MIYKLEFFFIIFNFFEKKILTLSPNYRLFYQTSKKKIFITTPDVYLWKKVRFC